MALLRSYSASFEQTGLTNAAVARWRFNEAAGPDALDGVDGLDGSYEPGAAPGAPGSIGDGAASFDGSTGFVLVETLSGTLRVATLGDSLATGLVQGSGGFQPAGQTFADKLPAALEARGLTVDYFDHALPGDRTDQGLGRVDDVIDDTPDVVILELGTNDAIQKVDPDTVEDYLRDIIGELQDGGVEHILLTGTFGYFPERSSGSRGYDTEADRAALEGKYELIAGDTPGVVLLNDPDGSDKFLGGERDPGDPNLNDDVIVGGVLDDGDPNDLTADGLHPNAAGIDVIVPRVAPQTIALGAAAGVVNEPLLLASGSFEMWFTVDALGGGRQTLFAKDSAGHGTGGQVTAYVSPAGRLGFALGDEDTNYLALTAADKVTAGAPTHLVANFGDGGMRVFLDGVEVATNAYAGGLDAGLGNFEPLVIGAGTGSSTPGTTDDLDLFFHGTIDEFAIYDRPLTATQVEALFEGGEFGTAVVGTAGDDTILGGSDGELLQGGRGQDVIQGKGGADLLRGGRGADVLLGGDGADELFGGRGADDLRGGAGDDLLDGKEDADGLTGGAGRDILRGHDGPDLLTGSRGADQLFGNLGRDELRGGPGDDLLNGGAGPDTLIGGAGSDTFQINRLDHGVDRILDFEDGLGGDVLDLSAVVDTGGGEIGNFVELQHVGDNTRVAVDPAGGSDFTVVFNLVGSPNLDLTTLVAEGNIQTQTV